LHQRQYGAVMLDQIMVQSEAFSKLAANIHGRGSLVVRAYDRTGTIARDLLANEYKVEMPEDEISAKLKILCAGLRK